MYLSSPALILILVREILVQPSNESDLSLYTPHKCCNCACLLLWFLLSTSTLLVQHANPSVHLLLHIPKYYDCPVILTITLRYCREFEVSSLNFPGQVHKWQLSQFLHKGTERTYDTFLCDLALAARFIVVTGRSRIVGHFFSVKNAAKSLLIGLLKICNALVGLPSLLAQDLDHKMIEERCRFLVAELECRVSCL